MDSYVTYCRLQVRNPAGFRCCNSLPHPTSLLFPSMDVVFCKCRWEDLGFYIGGACPPTAPHFEKYKNIKNAASGRFRVTPAR